MTKSSENASGGFWKAHYDSLADHESLELFAAEACDYFDRLTGAVPLASDARVLDFGCGLGFVSELLSSRVGELCYWDYSPNMLEAASVRLRDAPNSRAIDLSNGASDYAGAFDLIVVNSVIQYMSTQDLKGWLRRWRSLLSETGMLVLSDVILPEPAFLSEVRESLGFAAKGGFLLRTLKNDFGQYLRYLKARRHAVMSRYSKEDLTALASEAGFDVQLASANLTYRSRRFTALLTPTESSPT